jgi:hypothetical protein
LHAFLVSSIHTLPVSSSLTLSFYFCLAKRRNCEAPHWISDKIFVWSW